MSHHNRRRRCRIAIVALVCVAYQLGAVPLALMAAEFRLSGGILEIHHHDRLFVDPVDNRRATLTSKPEYILRDGESFSLVLKDQNPLLFTYNVTTTEVESEQHKIAAQFAKVLSEVMKPFESRAGGGAGLAAPQLLVIEGLDITEFRSQLRDVNTYLASIPRKLEQSISPDERAKMKDSVKAWEMPALAAKVRESYVRIVSIERKCLGGLPVSTDQGEKPCSSDIARGAAPAVPVAPPPPRAIGNNVAPPPGRGRRAGPAVNGQNGQGGAGVVLPNAAPPAATGDSISVFSALAASYRTEVLAAVEVLTEFAADAIQVGDKKTLKCRTTAEDCGYSLGDQTAVVTVKASSKYATFIAQAAPAVKKYQADAAGDFTFQIKPYNPAPVSFAPAFVLLFAKNPTYRAEKVGDAFVVKADDPSVEGYNLAAMMTIRPKAWREPTFGGQFQVGVSPTKDKLAFYGGAGITVQSVFTIGAGVAWQQVKILDGLAEGDTIASADALKTKSDMVPGLYIHITVNTK
jgi:hypothetical protein